MNSTSEQHLTVLLIDDDEDDFIIIRDYFAEISHIEYELTWIDNYTDGLQQALSDNYDIVLVDYRLGEYTGLDLLETAMKNQCTTPIIMLTGKGDKEVDLKSMKAGAYDFLVKSELNADNLERSIRYATDRAKNRDIIIEQQNRYRDIFQQSYDAIFIVDTAGNFTGANNSMLKLINADQQQLMAMKFSDLFADEGGMEAFLEKNKATAGNVETELKTTDGKLVACAISAVEVKNSSGQKFGLQGIIHDLTPLKKAEKELRLAEKLSLTGRLARTIAHEVRNPLTNINLATEQLLESLKEMGNEDLIIYPEIIQRNSRRINELITELLKSAKPSELSLEKVNPNDLIDEALSLCTDRIKLLEIKVNRNYSDSPPLLSFDVEKIKTALINIITNAIEAMEERENPVLSLATEVDKEDLVIHIHDNGRGMDRETANQLFDAFFTGKKHGMGLGMTTTQNIVKSHGGNIEVASRPGEGTTFTLRFKIERVTEQFSA